MSEDTLKYGSTIQLYASSALADHGLPHAVSLYEKHNLVCLGAPDALPITFQIIPTAGANGGEVCFGHKVIQVAVDSNTVLNSRTETWNNGYISLQEKSQEGELYIIFKTTDRLLNGTPMRLRDISQSQRVVIEVVSSRSKRVPDPIALTISKKNSSRVGGGYQRWDGSGQRVSFNVKLISKLEEVQTVLLQNMAISNAVNSNITSSTNTIATHVPSASRPLLYGDRVKQLVSSEYGSTPYSVGVYHRHSLAGVGPCVSADPEDFTESEFVILSGGHGKTGEVVRYCSSVVLADISHSGYVWNNKDTGAWSDGYVTVKPLSILSIPQTPLKPIDRIVSSTFEELVSSENIVPGQMHVSFIPSNPKLYGFPIHDHDEDVSIDVNSSHRVNPKFNYRMKVYRKNTSLLKGGYLTSYPNSSFKDCTFQLSLIGEGVKPLEFAKTSTMAGIAGLGQGNGVLLESHIPEPIVDLQELNNQYSHSYKMAPSARVSERQHYASIFGAFLSMYFLLSSIHEYISSTEEDVTIYLYSRIAIYACFLFLSMFASISNKKDIKVIRRLPKSATFCPHGLLPGSGSGASRSTSNLQSNHLSSPLSRSNSSYILQDSNMTGISSSSLADNAIAEEEEDDNREEWEKHPLTCEVPPRFIRAEKGDVDKARERYVKTSKWRQQNQLDTILDRPHPKFRAIKARTNQFFSGRGVEGNVVYYESPKVVKLPELEQIKITMDDLLYHFVYISEFLYQRLDTDPDTKCISVIDCTGIGMGDLGGEVKAFMQKISSVTQQHYPERSHSIVCINAPFSFKFVFNIIKIFMDPVTRSKTHLFGSNYMEKITPYITADNMPSSFNGMLDYTPGIPATGPELPPGALDPLWDNVEVLPLSPDEEVMFKIADAVNLQYTVEHPNTPIPVPKLEGVEDPNAKKKK